VGVVGHEELHSGARARPGPGGPGLPVVGGEWRNSGDGPGGEQQNRCDRAAPGCGASPAEYQEERRERERRSSDLSVRDQAEHGAGEEPQRESPGPRRSRADQPVAREEQQHEARGDQLRLPVDCRAVGSCYEPGRQPGSRAQQRAAGRQHQARHYDPSCCLSLPGQRAFVAGPHREGEERSVQRRVGERLVAQRFVQCDRSRNAHVHCRVPERSPCEGTVLRVDDVAESEGGRDHRDDQERCHRPYATPVCCRISTHSAPPSPWTAIRRPRTRPRIS